MDNMAVRELKAGLKAARPRREVEVAAVVCAWVLPVREANRLIASVYAGDSEKLGWADAALGGC